MKQSLIRSLTLVLLIFLSGCYPEGPEFVEELDVVYTDYDPEFNFAEQNTYAIPDSIVLIRDQNFTPTNGDTLPDFVEPEFGDVILERIRQNMNEIGWTEVEEAENADMLLLVTATTNTNISYRYDWRYWDWYGPGFLPGGGFAGGGWYYPGYTPVIRSDFRTGTLMIQMANPSEAGVNNNVPVEWIAVINGLLEGSRANLRDRIDTTIDQAFAQSPYLHQ